MTDQDESALLWAAVEDYAGSWEAVWELRSLHPEYDDLQLQGMAKDLLARLSAAGLIEFFECREPYGDMKEIDCAAALAVLARGDCWEAPADGTTSIRFAATPAGVARV